MSNTVDASEGTLLDKLRLREHEVTLADCEELAGNQGIESHHLMQAGKIIESHYNLSGMDFTKMPLSLLDLLRTAVQFQVVFVFYNPSLFAVDAARYSVNDGTRTSTGNKSLLVAPGAADTMKNFAMRLMASTRVSNQRAANGRYSENFS